MRAPKSGSLVLTDARGRDHIAESGGIWMLAVVLAATISATPGGTLNLPEPRNAAEWRRALESADQHLKALRQTVSDALPVIPDLGRQLRKLASEEGSTDSHERLVHDRFPAAYLIWLYKGYRFEGFEPNERVLRERFEKVQAQFEERQKCTTALLRGDPAPEECTELLSCSYQVGADPEGVFRYVIGKGYAVEKVRLTKPVDMLFDAPTEGGSSDNFRRVRDHMAGLLFDGCRLFAQLKRDYEPISAELNWKHFSATDTDREVFRDVCTRAPDAHPAFQELKELSTRFPKAKEIALALTSVGSYCEAGATTWCSRIEPVGDALVLARYDGCTPARATAADIRAAAATERTEAARVTLDQQAKWIDDCAAARAAGYQWKFYEPPAPEQCRPKSKPPTVAASVPPPAPVARSKSEDFPPATAALARRTNPPRTWSNHGWTEMKWGMGPGDVEKVLRDPEGIFRFDGERDCTVSKALDPRDVNCWAGNADHSFRVADLAPSLSFSFIEGELWAVYLHFDRTTDIASMLKDHRTLRELLEKKYGAPWYERVPERGEQEFWRGTAEWKTPTLVIELEAMTFRDEGNIMLTYKDPIRTERLNKRGAAKSEKKPTASNAKRAR